MGVNYLREYVIFDVRIYYIIIDGGVVFNIVFDKVLVWYYIRVLSREVVESIYERFVKVVKGVVMMIEIEVEVEFLGGCYNILNNYVLVNFVLECMNEIK